MCGAFTERIVALLPCHPSVCLTGTGMHCEYCDGALNRSTAGLVSRAVTAGLVKWKCFEPVSKDS